MLTQATDLAHLALTVRRLLDAELLLEEHGAALLAETDAARQWLEAGDAEAARHHIERLAQLTETLVEMKALALRDGQAVIQVSDSILNPATDENV